MILAGVLLKLGAYGFLRLVLPLYPQEAHHYAVSVGFPGCHGNYLWCPGGIWAG